MKLCEIPFLFAKGTISIGVNALILALRRFKTNRKKQPRVDETHMAIKAANDPSSSAETEQKGIAIRCSALLAIPSSNSLAFKVHVFTPALASLGRSLVSMRAAVRVHHSLRDARPTFVVSPITQFREFKTESKDSLYAPYG